MRTRTVLAAALTPGMRLSANRVITSATLTVDGRVHVVTAPGTAYTEDARPILTVTDYDIDQDVTIIERVPTAATAPAGPSCAPRTSWSGSRSCCSPPSSPAASPPQSAVSWGSSSPGASTPPSRRTTSEPRSQERR